MSNPVQDIDLENLADSNSSLPPYELEENIDAPASLEPKTDVQYVDWDGPNDPENPFKWSPGKKWLLTLTACFVNLIMMASATTITSAAADINARFGISDDSFPNSYWPVTSWNVGAATFPLIGLPLMESLGVRYGYLLSYAMFVIFIVPEAVAKNFATIVATRFVSGGFAGILECVTGAIVCDIWEKHGERSLPMSLYLIAVLGGITIGPLIGGGILRYLDWRWILYIELIFYGACFPFLIWLIKETRGPTILIRKAKRIRGTTGQQIFARAEHEHSSISQRLQESIVLPTRLLCTELVVFSFTLWSGFAFGTVFLFTQSITQTYATDYGWGTFLTSEVQAAVLVGEILGFLASLYQNRLYFRSAARNKESPGTPIPESRLWLSIPGSIIGLTAGFFWYAWTSSPSLPWILPSIGTAMVGFGIFTVASAVTNYVSDAYAKYAGSALSAVAFGENMFGAFLPLAAQAMYTNLGFGWASSLLGFMGLGLSVAPVVLLVGGRQIRRRSPFMKEASYT